MTDKLLSRGVSEVIVKEHLDSALKSGKKLRIKFGADPTAPDLHLGTAVVLRKLREFQQLGHKVIFLIGDYTAKVGDPSGRSNARPLLTDKEIKENAKTYFKQVGKILDVKKAEIRYNSEWYKGKKLDFFLELLSKFTAQRILERDDFTKRLNNKTEIYMHELLYPMLQAYDSVELKADIEIGGTDQKFNMLTGRDLQRHMGLSEQDVITVPLLVGTDGQKKMSKSVGNYIGITEDPNVMFGKIMAIPDSLLDSYYELCTDATRTISDPREAKLELGKIIVGIYHGAKAGEKAAAEFIRVFSEHKSPSNVPVKKVSSWNIVELLIESGAAASKSEARRLVEQGGVSADDRKIMSPMEVVSPGAVIKVGKHTFFKVEKK